MASLVAEDVWRDMALKEKCEAIDALLVNVADACKRTVAEVKQMKFADQEHAGLLMEQRRQARRCSDTEGVKQLSKRLQRRASAIQEGSETRCHCTNFGRIQRP